MKLNQATTKTTTPLQHMAGLVQEWGFYMPLTLTTSIDLLDPELRICEYKKPPAEEPNS
jgi:hypothetical protein